jgi:hypothetical protein
VTFIPPARGSARERLARVRIAAAYAALGLQVPTSYSWISQSVGVEPPADARPATREDTIEAYRLALFGRGLDHDTAKTACKRRT